MKTDNDPRTTEELKAEMTRLFREYLEFLFETAQDRWITMTEATEAIYGSSGRGNPRAVRIIESLAEYKLVQIDSNWNGKRRKVRVTELGFRLINNGTL